MASKKDEKPSAPNIKAVVIVGKQGAVDETGRSVIDVEAVGLVVEQTERRGGHHTGFGPGRWGPRGGPTPSA